MASPAEVTAMRRALELAARGPHRGPNPRVGAVLLDRTGQVVGEGYHRGAGTAHAEVDALIDAGDAAVGGTAVVTLEPCNHTGRTGPCTQALIRAGIARVVIATTDPNPMAAGGTDVLREAGIDVEVGVLETMARSLNRLWFASVRLGRPFVTWKFAATLDGRSAAADGTSQWITGPAARQDVHERRAEQGAIVAGTGTVLTDDAALTVRGVDGRPLPDQPLRVVVGQRDLPPTARVLDDLGGTAPVLHLRTRDPKTVVHELAERGIRSIWLEGGPTLAAAFLSAGLVDEVLTYVAPVLLGAGASSVADLGITTIGDAVRLHTTDVHRLGDDVLIISAPSVESPLLESAGTETAGTETTSPETTSLKTATELQGE